MSGLSLKNLETVFARERKRFVAEWSELLAIPTISADPAHKADVARGARWLAAHLRRIGWAGARLLATPGHPAVFAERRGAAGAPVVLVYGHYDVQPADPLAAWTTPPFQPTLRQGRLYARGAEDNKGQLFYVLKAMETLVAADALRCTVKVLLEGEEENGSRGLSTMLPRWRRLLRADVLLVTDTCTVPSGAPTLVMGLRGIVHATVALAGPRHDLHSGMHGGVAPNPATALARLLATLHTADGRIAVTGFEDGITPLSRRERALVRTAPFDARAYERTTGVPPVAGDRRFTPQERLGFRASIDVNGIQSGYAGRGSKTIIPARAEAKLTARLAAGQDPARSLAALLRHLRRHAPAGLRLEIPEQGINGPAVRVRPDDPVVRRAAGILRRLDRRPPAYLWEGASIPVVTALARTAGATPLLCGFGHDDDRIHAPDESFGIDQFRRGFLFAGLLLQDMGNAQRGTRSAERGAPD